MDLLIKYFSRFWGSSQYFPAGSMPVPEKRLFAQFHSTQMQEMKDEILKQLCSSESTIRVVFATVALEIEVDLKAYGVLFISPHHIPSGHIFRKLEGMDSQQVQCYTIITVTLQKKTKQGCKKQLLHFVKASLCVYIAYFTGY